MKKYMIFGLLATISINAFATTHPEGDEDFIAFVNQMDKERIEEDIEEIMVISDGERGDFLTYINATPEMLEIYNRKEKTAKFLSIENPAQYIKPGKCLLDTIGYDILEEMGATGKALECSWRLFCGSELNEDVPYAIELCGVMVED